MATFAEMMQRAGQRLQTGMNDPLTQLGLQVLMASGPMEKGTPFATRMAGALQGFAEQQAAMKQAQQQDLLRQIQMGQLQRQVQKDEESDQTKARVRQLVSQNPDMLMNNPLARAVLEGTGDYGALGDLSKYGPPQAKQPTPKWEYTEQLPGGMARQHIYDQTTGGYRTGEPFRSTQQQNVDLRGQGLQQQGQQFGQTMDWRQQTAQTQQQQWEAEQERKREADARKALDEAQGAGAQGWGVKEKAKWQQSRREARGATDSAIRMLDRLELHAKKLVGSQQSDTAPGTPEHPGLATTFGITGAFTGPMGRFAPDSANARAILESLRSMIGLSELKELKAHGASLGQVSNFENQMLQNALTSLQEAQTVDQARAHLNEVVKYAQDAKMRIRQGYDTDYGVEPWNAERVAPEGAPQQPAAAPTAQDTMTAADIEATMQETGWSREEVIRRAQAKGIKVGQ